MSRARLLCRSLPGVGLIEQTGPGQEQFVLNFLEANVIVPLLQDGLPKARRDVETLTARHAMRAPAVRSEARLTVLGSGRHYQNDHEPLTDLQAAALLRVGMSSEDSGSVALRAPAKGGKRATNGAGRNEETRIGAKDLASESPSLRRSRGQQERHKNFTGKNTIPNKDKRALRAGKPEGGVRSAPRSSTTADRNQQHH